MREYLIPYRHHTTRLDWNWIGDSLISLALLVEAYNKCLRSACGVNRLKQI